LAQQRVRRPYLGESAEDRINSRRRLLLDVAFERMAVEGGWRQASIAELCRAAQLNKRYFYESFDHLDELAGAVVDDLAAQLLTVATEAAEIGLGEGFDTERLARSVLAAAIGWLVEDPRRATVLFATASDHPRAQAHRREAVDALAAGLAAFSVEYHRAPERLPIVEAGSALLVGGSIEAVRRWLDGETSMSLDELVDDLAAFWMAVGSSAVELTERRGTPADPAR